MKDSQIEKLAQMGVGALLELVPPWAVCGPAQLVMRFRQPSWHDQLFGLWEVKVGVHGVEA